MPKFDTNFTESQATSTSNMGADADKSKEVTNLEEVSEPEEAPKMEEVTKSEKKGNTY